jgi:hypothetical protein
MSAIRLLLWLLLKTWKKRGIFERRERTVSLTFAHASIVILLIACRHTGRTAISGDKGKY